MRIVELTRQTRKNILNDLLKRSPNNYGQYEATVNDIIKNVRENGDKALFEYTLAFDKFPLSGESYKGRDQGSLCPDGSCSRGGDP